VAVQERAGGTWEISKLRGSLSRWIRQSTGGKINSSLMRVSKITLGRKPQLEANTQTTKKPLRKKKKKRRIFVNQRLENCPEKGGATIPGLCRIDMNHGHEITEVAVHNGIYVSTVD